MNAPSSIEFVLRGKTDGADISPRTIGLSQFNEFNNQVEVFLGGSDRLKLDNTRVEILQGSYALRVLLSGAAIFASLETDLRALQREDALGELDPKRAEIVQKWQSRAKSTPDLAYEIRVGDDMFPVIRINHGTDYRIGEVQPWVGVEKYLLGRIVDMGGAQKSNVHLRLDRGGRLLMVGTSQGYLQEQEQNRLYHRVLLHVHAEQHHRTGDLRNIRLISFVDYEHTFSEEALDRFAAKGAEAWADVPDAAGWVRELRGE